MGRKLHELNHYRNHEDGYKEWLKNDFLFIHVPKFVGTSISDSLSMPDLGHYTYEKLVNRVSKFVNKIVYFAVYGDPID